MKNVDEHKHKILVTFVFSMVISKVKKKKTPSTIHKQTQKLNKRRSTRGEAQQEEVHKRREVQQEKKQLHKRRGK
jgi:hypothetical protein